MYGSSSCSGQVLAGHGPVPGLAFSSDSGSGPQGVTVMQAFVAFLNRLVREEEGQDMVEYALILGLVSIVAVIAVTATGTAVKSIWEAVQAAVEAAIP